jgi:hypothetical protein
MRLGIFLLLLISQGRLCGQIHLAKKPFQPYFEEIQIARLPEPDKYRDGFVFFIAPMKYYADSIPAILANTIARTGEARRLLDPKKTSDRYYNYAAEFHKVTFHEEGRAANSFRDTIHFTVTARRYETYWSWKSLQRKERFVSLDTIYIGKLSSRHYMDRTMALTQELKAKDSEIILYRHGREIFRKAIEIKPLYLPITFSDPLFPNINIHRKLNYAQSTIEIGKRGQTLIIYFPIYR